MSKAYLLVICLLAVHLTGCLDDFSDDNEKPIAKIENKKDFYEITCKRSAWMQDDTLKLNGVGYDSDGIVWGYEWKSSIDGIIGTEQNITIPNLSTGNHTISFSVKDDKGKWSTSSNTKLNVKNHLCGCYLGIARLFDDNGNWTIDFGVVNPSLEMSNITWNLLDNNNTLVKSGQGSDLTNESAGISYSGCVNNDGIDFLCKDKFFMFNPGEGILSEFESIEDFLFYLTYNPTNERLGSPLKFQT